jgi:hypothetical protein
VYTNETQVDFNFLDDEERKINIKNYHHISDFEIDSSDNDKKDFFGKVSKQNGNRNYIYIEVKPAEDCLININLNYASELILIPLNREIIGVINNYDYDAYFDFRTDTDEVLITVTSLDPDRQVDVYLKTNIVDKETITSEGIKYSKASKTNFDLKGTTHLLTSAISLKIRNAPRMMRTDTRTVRILINIHSNAYLTSHRVKILASPVINNTTRIRPEQNKFYFTGFEKKYTERTVFTLKNMDKNDDLMIIEVSACKGNFIYTLTDTAPLDTETYMDLKKREITSRMYSSNGKKIITVRNLEESEYFLTLFGANNKRDIDFILNQDKDPNQRPEGGNEVDVLFSYYTTTEKKYNYLVTNDLLHYDTTDDFYSVKFNIPEQSHAVSQMRLLLGTG